MVMFSFNLYLVLFSVIIIDYLKYTKKGLLSLSDWFVSDFMNRLVLLFYEIIFV